MSIRPPPPPPPSLLKAILFCFHNNHTISSLTYQNDLNITLPQLCRDGRLKDAMNILLTTNTDTHYSLRSSTCLQILQTCIANNALPEATILHSLVNRIGLNFDLSTHKFLRNRPIYMYVKCRSFAAAREVFDCITKRDIFSWNMIISGYQKHGFPRQALTIFHQMQQTAAVVQPDQFTFSSILKACTKLEDLQQGFYIHQKLFQNGFLSQIVVANALVDMYAKCGSVEKARQLFDKTHDADTVSWTAMVAGYAKNGYVERARELFDKMPHRDAVSWNAMIAGCTQNGFSEKALKTFKQMQLSDVKPNSITFASILPACTTMGALEEGMGIHQRVVENGLASNIVVVNALIDMYAKCGSIEKAHELFDRMHDANTVSWTAMIVGYAQKGNVERARKLFDKMPRRDAASWNAMIAGYAQNAFSEQALETFRQMQLSDVKPNSVTFASILPACASMGALQAGMDIHQRVVKNGFSLNTVVVNALIDIYAKCGRIQKARELFDKMHDADTVSWNVMIGGYAIHGYSKDALNLFDLMKHLGTNPNSITFVCVLLACRHAGLVDEGCKYFNSMSDSYCIIPGMNHYTSIVDLLGRAGYLEEALNVIVKMPIKPESFVWMSLLGACRLYKNVGIGEFVATILFLLEPKCAPSYVLLSHIYGEVGWWDDVQRVRILMKDREIKKTPGCSWIEVDKRVHAFLVGDRSHPQTREIYEKLEKLSCEMKAVGYIPNAIPALRDVDTDDKELLLCQHSEKLAIAFGLLKTPPRTVITVVKNLRVCYDCHSATKFISKIVARDIVVRDANRFHHFKHGECSCGDYW